MKAVTEFLSSNLNKKRVEHLLFALLIFLLPTQLGKHFWPDFSYIQGIRVDYLSPTIYVTDLIIIVLFFMWGAAQTTRLKNLSFQKVFFNKRKAVLLVVACYLLFNVILSSHIQTGVYTLLKIFEFLFLGFYIATTVKTERQLFIGIVVFGASMIGQMILALGQFSTHGSLGGVFYFFGERNFNAITPGIANASVSGELILRPYGTFPHPNVLAGYLLCFLLSMTFLLLRKQRLLLRLFTIVGFGLGIVTLGLTLSRIAVVLGALYLLAGFAVSVLTKNKKSANRTLLWTWLIGGGVACVVFVLSPLGARLLQTNLGEESLVNREQLGFSAWQLFLQHPLVGVGLGNFLQSIAEMQKPLSLTQYLQPVHNIYLFVAAEGGIIGLLFFVWFLGRTTRQVIVSYKNGKGNRSIYGLCAMMLFTLLVIGLFDHYLLTLQQGQLLFSVVLGLCWTSVTNES